MITKAHALAKMTEKDTTDYNALDKKVEEQLAAYNGGQVSVGCEEFSPKAIDKIKRHYENEGGWTVDLYHGDQRDPGPWLKFS